LLYYILNSGAKSLQKKILSILLILACGLVLFFFNLGGWDLWNPDEPRYAQIAKEMLKSGNFLIPHLNGEVYYDKPPLFFALIALSYKLIGKINSFSARLPSAFFSLLTLIVVFYFGKRLKNETAGLISALVLATSFQFFWLSRRANIDSTLVFFTTLSIFSFHVGISSEKRKWLLYLAGYLSMALGFFVKLQPAIVVPFLALVPYFVWEKGIRFIFDKSHLPGIILFLGLILGWGFMSLKVQGMDYLKGLLWEKSASTFLESSGHNRPIYYYLYDFPLQFLPWTFLLVSSFIFFIRKKYTNGIFLLSWFGFVFIFFSLAEAKRGLYLLPIFPAASLMVGWFLEEIKEEEELIKYPFLALGLLFLLFAIIAPIVGTYGKKLVYQAPFWGILFALLAGIGGILILLSKNKFKKFGITVGCCLILYFLSCWKVFPALNPYASYRPFCEKIMEVYEKGDELVVYKLQGAEINFYTGIVPLIRVYDETILKELLLKKRVICVLKKSDLSSLQGIKIRVITIEKVGNKELAIITNKGGSDADSAS
jgi:4-amino-4-deoxy-L-arabinose transferase-like glycosyltransferase